MPWISPVAGRLAGAPVAALLRPRRALVLAGAGVVVLAVAALLAVFLLTVALLAFLGVAFFVVATGFTGALALAALPRAGAALAALARAGVALAAAFLAGDLLVLAARVAAPLTGAFLAAVALLVFFAAGLRAAGFVGAGFLAEVLRALDALAPAAVLPVFFLLDRDAAAITRPPEQACETRDYTDGKPLGER